MLMQPQSALVASLMGEGQVVPAEITIGLLKEAIECSGTRSTVIIDGFPRKDSNREVFQEVVGYDCEVTMNSLSLSAGEPPNS